MTARVFVTLKKAVLDPQGKAVQRSLARLGFPQARDVRAFPVHRRNFVR
jgi:phosphoribosylformylglycinamidine synthase subunit PurS